MRICRPKTYAMCNRAETVSVAERRNGPDPLVPDLGGTLDLQLGVLLMQRQGIRRWTQLETEGGMG